MINETYATALGGTPVKSLADFVKDSDVELYASWKNLGAADKRKKLMEAFQGSPSLRMAFRQFYGDFADVEIYPHEWEAGEPVGEPVTGSDVGPEVLDGGPDASTSVTEIKVGAFVEGTFQSLVADVAGLNAQDSAMNLRELEDSLEMHHFRLGVLLNHINHQQHYVTLGHDTMRQYIEGTTGIQYRKAAYLMSNAATVVKLGIQPDDLKGVSWSALRYIAPVMTEENAKEWLDMARSVTQGALSNAVKDYANKQKYLEAPKPVGDVPKTIAKVFNLEEDQKLAVDAAIEAAKAEGNVDSNAAALELIVASYTGKPPSNATVSKVLPDTSDDALRDMMTKMAHEEGVDAAVRILNLVSEVWPDLEISVEAPANVAA